MSEIPTRTLQQLIEHLRQLCTCGRGSNVELCIYCDAHDQIEEQNRVLAALDYAREPVNGEDLGFYSAEHAIRTAKLWRAGKLIGADKDQVLFALLRKIEAMEDSAERARDRPV